MMRCRPGMGGVGDGGGGFGVAGGEGWGGFVVRKSGKPDWVSSRNEEERGQALVRERNVWISLFAWSDRGD